MKGADYVTEIVARLNSCSSLSKNTSIKIHRPMVLHVVLYGCVTWSLTLREERRLRELENRVPRKILGPKMEWRKLHNEELNDLCFLAKCCSGDQI